MMPSKSWRKFMEKPWPVSTSGSALKKEVHQVETSLTGKHSSLIWNQPTLLFSFFTASHFEGKELMSISGSPTWAASSTCTESVSAPRGLLLWGCHPGVHRCLWEDVTSFPVHGFLKWLCSSLWILQMSSISYFIVTRYIVLTTHSKSQLWLSSLINI